MSDAKHTPGPWVLIPGDSIIGIQTESRQLIAATNIKEYWKRHGECRAVIHRLQAALTLIAAMEGKTLIAPSRGDDFDIAHQVGANAAFNQAAHIAKTALSLLHETTRGPVMTVPEQAVEAAKNAILHLRWSSRTTDEDIARACVTAALPLLGVMRREDQAFVEDARQYKAANGFSVIERLVSIIDRCALPAQSGSVQCREDVARAEFVDRMTGTVDPGPDIRWAVNILLEKIAEKFEGWDTHDIWRSDAAMVVRSFKNDALSKPAGQPVEGLPENVRTRLDLLEAALNEQRWIDVSGHAATLCNQLRALSPAPASPHEVHERETPTGEDR